MKNAKEDVIVALAFSFKDEYFEAGAMIQTQSDTSECLFIVFEGIVEVFTEMDNGTKLLIQTLVRGSIININGFLNNGNKCNVNYRCLTQVCLYVIPRGRFLKIVRTDKRHF